MIDNELRELAQRCCSQEYDVYERARCGNRVALAMLAAHPEDGDEPADSTWAESVGFEFSDRDKMYKYVGTGKVLKVVLTGDVTMCEKDRHLSLYWTNYPGGQPRHSWTLSVDDNPTRDRVRLLFAGLGEPLEEKGGAT